MSIVEVVLGSLDEYPLLLTVEEAAGVLRIGRSLAYELARTYESSDGHAGLPVCASARCCGCLAGRDAQSGELAAPQGGGEPDEVAVVDPASLPILAQARPGITVRFRLRR